MHVSAVIPCGGARRRRTRIAGQHRRVDRPRPRAPARRVQQGPLTVDALRCGDRSPPQLASADLETPSVDLLAHVEHGASPGSLAEVHAPKWAAVRVGQHRPRAVAPRRCPSRRASSRHQRPRPTAPGCAAEVGRHHLGGRALGTSRPPSSSSARLAQPLHGAEVVADEEHGPALARPRRPSCRGTSAGTRRRRRRAPRRRAGSPAPGARRPRTPAARTCRWSSA